MKDEPVWNGAILKVLVTVILMITTKIIPGLDLTADQAMTIAVAIFGVVTAVFSFLTRKKVAPMTKIEARLATDHPAALAALKRPS